MTSKVPMRKFLRKASISICWPALAFRQGQELARKKDRYWQLLSIALYLSGAFGAATSLAGFIILVVLTREGPHIASFLVLGFTAHIWKQCYRQYRLDRQAIRIDLMHRRKFGRALKPL